MTDGRRVPPVDNSRRLMTPTANGWQLLTITEPTNRELLDAFDGKKDAFKSDGLSLYAKEFENEKHRSR